MLLYSGLETDVIKTVVLLAIRPCTDLQGTSAEPLVLCAESKDDQDAWLQVLSAAAVPDAWPGGLDFTRRPQPLLYSMWVVQHTPAGRAAAAAGSASSAASSSGSSAVASAVNGGAAGGAGAPAAAKIPSPFPRLPALKAAPAWQRKSLLLQKLRICSVVFDGVDPARCADDHEVKRNTLLEVVDFCDASARALFADYRVLDDTFTMVSLVCACTNANPLRCEVSVGYATVRMEATTLTSRLFFPVILVSALACSQIKLNLFRSLPRAPDPTGDPEEEEAAFSDAQWPHLSIVYELLLRLVRVHTMARSSPSRLGAI